MSRIAGLLFIVLWIMGPTVTSADEDPGQPTGHFLSPMGSVPGLATVAVEVQDPDGLDRVWVTFVENGAPLLLCGPGAPEDCSGTTDLFSREEVDPMDHGAMLGPVTAALWVRDVDGIEEIAAEVTFLLEEDPTPRHNLTVFRQGEGGGSLHSVPDGIDCGSDCTQQSAEFVAGTEVEILATGDDFVGFAGDRCFGTAPCRVSMDRDLDLFATFESSDSFRLLSTYPIPGATDLPAGVMLWLLFDREVEPGPNWTGVSVTNEEGDPLEIALIIPAVSRDRVAISVLGMDPGKAYRLEVPAGVVQDLDLVPLPEGAVVPFTTIEEENPPFSLAVTPDLMVEGSTATFDLWLDRPSSSDRIVHLQVEPSGSLLLESPTVTLPAGTSHTTFRATAGEIDEDTSAWLRATEAQLGTTRYLIPIADLSPSLGLPLRLDGWTLLEDDNGNGILDAGEEARYRMILCNEGEIPIPQFVACLSVVNVVRDSFLGPIDPCKEVGFMNPGQCRFRDFLFHSEEELPADEYWIRITSSTDPIPFVVHASIPVQNEALPNYQLSRTDRGFSAFEPGETVYQHYIAHNRGDGSDPRLPVLRFSIEDVDGQVVQELRGFVDARRDTNLDYFLAFEAPEESGEYFVSGEINPPPNSVPETRTDDNHADPFSFVVNRAMTLDVLGGPYRVDMVELFVLTVSAQDPEGDTLELLLPEAPEGMAIESLGPDSARILWTPPESPEPSSHEVRVEVRDEYGRTDTGSFTLLVDRQTDLTTRVSSAPSSYEPGLPFSFQVEVHNRGPLSLTGADFFGFAEPFVGSISWSCAASSGSTCSGAGTQLQDLALELAANGIAMYDFTVDLPLGAPDLVTWTLCVRPDPPGVDGTPGNDCGTAAVSVAVLDFGDAPDSTIDGNGSYPTRLEDDGARHGISLLRLGTIVDNEDDGQPSFGADGDDLSGADEDGLAISEAPVGDAAVLEVDASGPGLLSAWVDWNRDGDWLDAGEQVLADHPLAGEGPEEILLPVSGSAVPGSTVGRFRLSTLPGLGIGGPAPDGEVEDHPVEIVAGGADLTVDLTDHRIYAAPGRSTTYRARVRNLGPEAAMGAEVRALLPAELLGCQWTCEADLGSCTATGIRDLLDTLSLDPGGQAIYTLQCEVDPDADASGFLVITASIEPSATSTDPVPENNSATDSTELAPLIFADGFESGDASGWDEP